MGSFRYVGLVAHQLARASSLDRGLRLAAKRAFDAMMTMKKIDIATIEAARRGPGSRLERSPV